MPRYTTSDYINMSKCVQECGNIVSEAQTLYAHLYGEKPKVRTMLNAVERFPFQSNEETTKSLPVQTYKKADYINMAACFQESDTATKAQELYEARYGQKPPINTIIQANEWFSETEIETVCSGEPGLNMELDEGPEIKIKDEEQSEDIRLASIPIVFTTKLDDMRIFNQYNDSMTSKDITNTIWNESMPKYNNRKPIIKTSSKVSYQDLTCKIEKINLKASYENLESNKINVNTCIEIDQEADELVCDDVRKRNEKLLKKCKPLRIVLEKIFFESDEEPEPLNKKKKLESNEKMIHLMVFQDYSLNQTDIYCIQNGIIIENYTVKNVSVEATLPFISAYNNRSSVILRKVDFCCWHQREAFIVSLNFSQYNLHVKDFMKTPHNCPFGQCTCCCRSLNEMTDEVVVSHAEDSKKQYSNEISAEDMEINDLEKEIAETFHEIKQKSVEYGYKSDWHENLLTETKEIDTLVGKALSYTRSSSDSAKGETSNSSLTNYKTKFIHQFHCKNAKNRVETFELQSEGNLLAYLNQDISSMIMPVTYQNRFGISNEEFSIGRACCWYEREKNISKLNSHSPSLARFMKLPHTCQPNECKCCCKPRKTPSLLLNVLLPNRNVPTAMKEKNNTDKKSYENIGIPYVNGRGPKCDNRNQAKTVKSLDTKKSTKEHSRTGSQDTISKQNITTSPLPKRNLNNEIENPDFTKLQKNSIVSPPTKILEIQSNQTNNQLQQDTVVLPTDNNAEDFAVGSMITTILDRFKNVRLTITDDGKVAAALNAPANTLNTAELKVLANILSHAQKQVKELGLGPGSSLNTNDLQKTVNMAAQSLPASQVPIHSQGKIRPMASSTKIKPVKETVPKLVNIYPKPQIFNKPAIVDKLSSISQDHNQFLLQSYSSYVECKKNPTLKDEDNSNIAEVSGNTIKKIDVSGGIPKISSVFSLQDSENDGPQRKSLKSSALGAWSKSTNSDSTVAPTSKMTNSKPNPPSKIRVVDPAKLGIKTADPVSNEKTHFKILNENLIKADNNLNSDKRKLVSTTIQVGTIPMGHIAPEIQSLPKISNVVGNAAILPEAIPSNTHSQNNILVINPLQPSYSMTNKNVFTGSGNIQLVKNKDMNTISQNIQVMPQTSSATTVFHISNLDRMSIAEPRLLNAEPVPSLRLNPPPLVKVLPKPTAPDQNKRKARRNRKR